MDTDLKGMREMAAKWGKEMSPHLVSLLNHPWTAEDFTSAKMMRQRICNHMWRFMQKYDLLLTGGDVVDPWNK